MALILHTPVMGYEKMIISSLSSSVEDIEKSKRDSVNIFYDISTSTLSTRVSKRYKVVRASLNVTRWNGGSQSDRLNFRQYVGVSNVVRCLFACPGASRVRMC